MSDADGEHESSRRNRRSALERVREEPPELSPALISRVKVVQFSLGVLFGVVLSAPLMALIMLFYALTPPLMLLMLISLTPLTGGAAIWLFSPDEVFTDKEQLALYRAWRIHALANAEIDEREREMRANEISGPEIQDALEPMRQRVSEDYHRVLYEIGRKTDGRAALGRRPSDSSRDESE